LAKVELTIRRERCKTALPLSHLRDLKIELNAGMFNNAHGEFARGKLLLSAQCGSSVHMIEVLVVIAILAIQAALQLSAPASGYRYRAGFDLVVVNNHCTPMMTGLGLPAAAPYKRMMVPTKIWCDIRLTNPG
jgi:hypothetical protein